MVEHMECPRAFLGKPVPQLFFFPLKTALLPCDLTLAGLLPPSRGHFGLKHTYFGLLGTKGRLYVTAMGLVGCVACDPGMPPQKA